MVGSAEAVGVGRELCHATSAVHDAGLPMARWHVDGAIRGRWRQLAGRRVDPVDDILYVTTQTSLCRAQLAPGSPKAGVLYHDTRGQFIGPQPTAFGLPLLKPPYGRLVAVDLKTGDRVWMVPHGNTRVD